MKDMLCKKGSNDFHFLVDTQTQLEKLFTTGMMNKQ